jgi:hypothetical protein
LAVRNAEWYLKLDTDVAQPRVLKILARQR